MGDTPDSPPDATHIHFSKGTTVYGDLPRKSRSSRTEPKQVTFQNAIPDSRATVKRSIGSINAGTKSPERNVPGMFREKVKGKEYEFTGVPVGTHDFSQPAFQAGLDQVAEGYKLLRSQGKQPAIDVTGLASSSVVAGKGSDVYAKQRADELKKQLQKRGVPADSIRTDIPFGPYPDARLTSPKEKALSRGAIIKFQDPGVLAPPENRQPTPIASAMKSYFVSQETTKRFTDSEGLPNSPMYYFAKLYEIITRHEIRLALDSHDQQARRKLRYPDFLLIFIPIFYDMYKRNVDLYMRNKDDDNLAPDWKSYFDTIRNYDDKSNYHLQRIIQYGVRAHIQGDMAGALVKAYQTYSAGHPEVRFDDLKNDFFDINKKVFNDVLTEFQLHLVKIKRPLDLIPDEGFNYGVLWFGGTSFGSWLNDSFSIDDVFEWREAQWQKAKKRLRQ